MQYIKPDIQTICVGVAMSMGALLLAGGTEGKRMALPSSKILIHQLSGGFEGQATDIEIHAREIIDVRRRLDEILAKHTNQPLDKVKSDTERDYFMSPEEAVSHSAELFTQHLNLFVKFRDNIERHEQDLRGEKTSQNRLMDTPIEELDLSVRAFNCLKANEIQTVGQLLQKREEELLALRNFGRKSLDEIKEKLVEKGFIKPEEMGTVLRG